MLLENVQATIDRHGMFEPDETVLVAVSGGVDSVVLLNLLRRLAPSYRLSLVVAHLDHGLREASPDDARFVERLGREADLPVVSERIDVGSAASGGGLGLEAAAREARHSFLRTTAHRVGASKIALGHTASDRAETILFHLARGSGGTGLRGIEPINGTLVRPLIERTRSEILDYARHKQLTWVDDPSNTDLAFSRNRIRHHVLPELERINSRIVEAICRAGDLVAELDVAASFLVSRLWKSAVVRQEEGQIVLRRSSLAALPAPVQHLAVREAFSRVRGDLNGIERTHIEAACIAAVSPATHSELDLPRLFVRVQADEIAMSGRPFPRASAWSSPVELGYTAFAQHGFVINLKITPRANGTVDPSDRMSEVADVDRVSFPLNVRTRRPGDRFVPLGMECTVKLKDFLINERVPIFERDRVPLLCDRERILWIVGVRLSNEVRVTKATERVLVMRAEETS